MADIMQESIYGALMLTMLMADCLAKKRHKRADPCASIRKSGRQAMKGRRGTGETI